MASLQINTMTGDQASALLHEAAIIAAQRGNRLCDITIDLTAGVGATTDNRPDTGQTGKKH